MDQAKTEERTLDKTGVCVIFDLAYHSPTIPEHMLDCRPEHMVKKRLASVVTRLWLQSACDRDLVATAAAKLVEANKDEILKYLQQPLP